MWSLFVEYLPYSSPLTPSWHKVELKTDFYYPARIWQNTKLSFFSICLSSSPLLDVVLPVSFSPACHVWSVIFDNEVFKHTVRIACSSFVVIHSSFLQLWLLEFSVAHEHDFQTCKSLWDIRFPNQIFGKMSFCSSPQTFNSHGFDMSRDQFGLGLAVLGAFAHAHTHIHMCRCTGLTGLNTSVFISHHPYSASWLRQMSTWFCYWLHDSK